MATTYRLNPGRIPPEQALAGIRRKIGDMVPYVVQLGKPDEEPVICLDYPTARMLSEAGFEVEGLDN